MAKKKAQFFNRELSWLQFNQRVLQQAMDESVPLMDRLMFLSITGSNLDEFFMVRVGSLEMMIANGIRKRDVAGLLPREQLAQTLKNVRTMKEAQYSHYEKVLEPALAEIGLKRVRTADLTGRQVSFISRYFETEVFPVISPIAFDPERTLPHLANLMLHLAVRLKSAAEDARQRIAVIPMGSALPRFVRIPCDNGEHAYMLMEDVISTHITALFEGEQVLETVPFRITRNADLAAREDQAADFMAEMEEIIDARELTQCVRMEIQKGSSRTLVNFMQRTFGIREQNTFELPAPLDISALSKLASVEGFDRYRNDAWPPQIIPELDLRKSFFKQIAAGDILMNHPYDSFDPVVKLIEEAASDPNVLAIKQTLYRTSANSPIMSALAQAAERGKYVTVIVELKARFDEERNIEGARALERAGVQVIYGVRGLKTHSKVCLIVRRESAGIVRYMHFGTGNYNEKTAKIYSDISLLTCDEDLGADTSAFFNAVTGYSELDRFTKIAAAPHGLRSKLLEMIEGETERCRQGQKASIRAKMNSLVCPKIIQSLYEASNAGVQIELNIRGICCLRPGVKGLSENIRVISIVDRFLEHSRIFYFHHGGERSLFIASADWMPRNLDRRVELMVPVEDRACKRKLIAILDIYFKDNVKAMQLQSNGEYSGAEPGKGKKARRAQEMLYKLSCDAVKKAKAGQRTSFEPYTSADKS